MKLLVTRPTADADALAQTLEAAGHTVIVDPLIDIRPIAGAIPDLDGVTGLVFTSANGVRAFAAASERRDLPVFSVGRITGSIARELGFTAIESADGDVDALIGLIGARRKPEDGILLHAGGAVRAGNLQSVLEGHGYEVRTAVLYEGVEARSLSPETLTSLRDEALDGVLLFSPRTARLFAELVKTAGLEAAMPRLSAWCLSEAVAEGLGTLPLTRRLVAAEPNQAALLTLLGDAEKAEASPIQSGTLARKVPRGRSQWPALAILILLAGGGGALWWGSDVAMRSTPAPTPSLPVAAEPLPQAAAPVTAPAPVSPPVPAPIPDEAAARIEESLARLEARLARLEARPDPVSAKTEALAAELDAMARRVSALEGRQDTERGLVLAAGQIRTALAGSGPWAAPLAILQAAEGEDPALAEPLGVLTVNAKSGVPSRIRLAEDLAALPAKLGEKPPPGPDAGFWDRLSDRASRIVTIRRVDDGTGTLPSGPDKVVAEAGTALAQGDLAGAVQTVETLTPAPGTPLFTWLESARARLAAEQALARVDAALTARLKPSAGAGPKAGGPP